MEKELIINSTDESVEIALLQDKRLVELHQEKQGSTFNVGDIFLGTIKKTMPGLNAAFVEIGHPRDAFLHYTDCGPTLSSVIKYTKGIVKGKITTSKLDTFDIPAEIDKRGSIDNVFKRGDFILVQVLKEPISTKGPRLSCEITIPGRYVVLSPFKNVVAVSKKLSSEDERTRLKKLTDSIKPKNIGVIVRTAAEGKKVADIHEDILDLMSKWDQIYQKMIGAKKFRRVLKELDKTETVMRDILNDSFNKVVVNDPESFANMKEFLGGFDKERVKILDLYKGKRDIFDHYGVSKQIKSSFGKTYTMKSGAYLVIEHTEAMHVIDVNSGPKMKNTDQETAAIQVNLEAAREIAHQLKLRDLGGIVIIDFIDMRNPENKARLVKEFKDCMSTDRAQHTVLPLTKFGLMQITRQRTRPEINIVTAEACSSCKGTGKVTPSTLITDDIERDLVHICNARPSSKVILEAHPYVISFIKQGWPSVRMSWYKTYKKWIRLKVNANYALNQYKFYDENDDEIRLNA